VNVELGRLDGLAARRPGRPEHGCPPSKRALRLRLYVGLLIVDTLCMAAGFGFGNIVRFRDPLVAQGVNMFLLLLPIYLGTALNSRAYSMHVLVSSRWGTLRAMASLAFAVATVTFFAFYMRAGVDFSRIVFGTGTVASAVLIILGRHFFGIYAKYRFGESPLTEVIIKDGRECALRPGAFVIEARAINLRPDTSDPMMLDRIGRLLKTADRVIVACPPERRSQWAMALKGSNTSSELLSAEVEELGVLGTSRYVGQATMVVASGPLAFRDRLVKRVLDVALAGTAVLLLGPLMILVAIAIKLESPGPVFFVQERLGRGNRLFRMYKFRSMRTDLLDHTGNKSTSRDDDRVTRVGRIIRKTSVDELPQILNVLIGDMSLVGPRPHALGSTAGDKLFWEVDTRYWHRHATKPGLTGLAQVRGFRGATHCRSDLTNRLQADLEYLSGWTIWRDISILIGTFKVLVHKNAF
jgi:lipopolysaccharide/colanic/teichoic acid biosynthesis glycosyltransferase